MYKKVPFLLKKFVESVPGTPLSNVCQVGKPALARPIQRDMIRTPLSLHCSPLPSKRQTISFLD
jgi:hypothetical protein